MPGCCAQQYFIKQFSNEICPRAFSCVLLGFTGTFLSKCSNPERHWKPEQGYSSCTGFQIPSITPFSDSFSLWTSVRNNPQHVIMTQAGLQKEYLHSLLTSTPDAATKDKIFSLTSFIQHSVRVNVDFYLYSSSLHQPLRNKSFDILTHILNDTSSYPL
jgi:hypothetical protein